MEYVSLIKCTFISSTYVIFDFTITEKVKRNGKDTVVAEGNIILNRDLECKADIVYDEEENVKIEIAKVRDRCFEKAKWIFEHNVHVI